MAEAAQHPTVFDSGLQYLSGVYAHALLGATEKANSTDAVLAELQAIISDVLDKLPKLDSTLGSPRVPLAEKELILEKVFKGKVDVQLLNFLKVLVKRGRFNCVRAISTTAKRLLNEMRGRLEVLVTSAVPVEGELLSRIEMRLREVLKHEVDVRTAVNPEVLGGLVVRVGDTVYDGSVANRLSRLRDEAIRNSNQQMRQSLDRFVSAD